MDEIQRQVTITNGFYLSKFETTNAQWEAVMNGAKIYIRNIIMFLQTPLILTKVL